jgi:hypothetical protein
MSLKPFRPFRQVSHYTFDVAHSIRVQTTSGGLVSIDLSETAPNQCEFIHLSPSQTRAMAQAMMRAADYAAELAAQAKKHRHLPRGGEIAQ